MAEQTNTSLELTSIPRNASATRFQVNLVNHSANGEKEHPEDDDTFNDTEVITKRRTSRIQSLKSSFKSSDKQKKETAARFKVTGDDESDSNDEDENLLDGNEYDTKYGRSFR